MGGSRWGGDDALEVEGTLLLTVGLETVVMSSQSSVAREMMDRISRHVVALGRTGMSSQSGALEKMGSRPETMHRKVETWSTAC